MDIDDDDDSKNDEVLIAAVLTAAERGEARCAGGCGRYLSKLTQDIDVYDFCCEACQGPVTAEFDIPADEKDP